MLKILTLNIWNYEGPWKIRCGLIRDWIRLLDPDLIAFQEVLNGRSFNQAAVLFDNLHYQLSYGALMDFWLDPSLKFGNLVASRWPIADSDMVALPMGGEQDLRVLVAADIDSPYGTISFGSAHLSPQPHRGDVREQQIQVISEAVLERWKGGGLPPIICGDFNAAPESNEIMMMKGPIGAGDRSVFFEDAWESGGDGSAAHTYTRANGYLKEQFDERIDYIFVGPHTGDGGGRIDSCRVVCNVPKDGNHPSDHFGVYAELSTP